MFQTQGLLGLWTEFKVSLGNLVSKHRTAKRIELTAVGFLASMGVRPWLQSQCGREEALPAYWKAELRKNRDRAQMAQTIDGTIAQEAQESQAWPRR